MSDADAWVRAALAAGPREAAAIPDTAIPDTAIPDSTVIPDTAAAWHVVLGDGTRLTSVRPGGASYSEMMKTIREIFGHRGIVTVTPAI